MHIARFQRNLSSLRPFRSLPPVSSHQRCAGFLIVECKLPKALHSGVRQVRDENVVLWVPIMALNENENSPKRVAPSS
ncbi:unnamed protein product, partial [Ceratitis capitata]